MKGDGDLEQHSSSRHVIKWWDTGYILKLETKRPADVINKRCLIRKS